MSLSHNNWSWAGKSLVPHDLPEGWFVTQLKEVVTSRKGKKPKRVEDAMWVDSLPYVDIEAFEKGRVRRYAGVDSSTVAEEGDILVVWDGARCGLTGKAPSRGVVGSTLVTIEPFLIHPEYVFRFLQACFRTINSNPRGIGIPHVDPEIFWGLELPVPPREEQKRIVAKAHQLLARVNAVSDRLAKVQKILKRVRQAALAAACSGMLTKDWREDHPNDEARSLLARAVQACRESGQRWTDDSGQPEDDFEVPSNWVVSRMRTLTNLITSGSRGWAKYYADSGPLFIRAQDIRTDELNLALVAHVNPPRGAEGTRTRVEGNDLLVTITGANVTKSALVRRPMDEAYVSQHVALVRPALPELGGWLHLWVVSPVHGRKQLIDAAYGAGKPGLNLDSIRDVLVALPPLQEQVEILRRVNALLELSEIIERRLGAAAVWAERLPQAILAKAFSGELVATEAELARAAGRDYESAKVLLDRIRKERANPIAPTKGRRAASTKGPRGRRSAVLDR